MVRKIKRKKKTIKIPPCRLQAHSEVDLIVEDEDQNGLTIGRPFKTLSLGQVSSRLSGESVGSEITIELLNELVRVFKTRKDKDPVIIDWNHASSPFTSDSPSSPEAGLALGIIQDVKIVDDCLYVYPAYNQKGVDIITRSEGVLWSSPEYLQGAVYSRDGGKKLGEAQLLAVTLTPRPAQQVDKIETVTLMEDLNKMDLTQLSMEELMDLVRQKDEMVRELEAKLKDAQEDEAAKITPDAIEEVVEEVVEAVDLAEDDKKEDEDEDKKVEAKVEAMSERATINLLKEQVEKLRIESHNEKRTYEVDKLVNSGRITPSEVELAEDAYDLKEDKPKFWLMFSERPTNKAVPLNEIGHKSSGQKTSIATINDKIQQLSEQNNISYTQALAKFRAENHNEYNRAYGVKS